MWNPLANPAFGLTYTLSRVVATAADHDPTLVPELGVGRTLLAVSDYGGEHAGSRYRTYCFVFVASHSWPAWEAARKKVRRGFRLGRRRMLFKGMGDRLKRTALPAFLDATDHLAGLCVVVAVDKAVDTLLPEKVGASETTRTLASAFGADVVERLLRIVHLVGMFISCLSAPGQDVIWVTDRDAIASTPERVRLTSEVAGRVCAAYLRHDMGALRFGSASSDNGTLQLWDLVSIADLVAGSAAEVLTAYDVAGVGLSSTIVAPVPPAVTRKSRLVASWLARDGALKRLVLMVRKEPGSQALTVARLKPHVGTEHGILWVPTGEC